MTARSTSGLGLPDDAGLQLEAVYRRFDGEPFGDGSPEYVFVRRVEPRRLSRSA
jgi:hypothetical protein